MMASTAPPTSPDEEEYEYNTDSEGSYTTYDSSKDSKGVEKERYMALTLVAQIKERDKKCVLCGGTDELRVVRLTGQSRMKMDGIGWLKWLNIVEKEFHRDDPHNLFTACKVHAESFAARAWTFCPTEAARAVFFELSKQREKRTLAGGDLVGDTKPPVLERKFELLVFRPWEMVVGERQSEDEEWPWEEAMYTKSHEVRLFSLPLNPSAVFCRAVETSNNLFPGVDERCQGIEVQLMDTKNMFNTSPPGNKVFDPAKWAFVDQDGDREREELEWLKEHAVLQGEYWVPKEKTG